MWEAVYSIFGVSLFLALILDTGPIVWIDSWVGARNKAARDNAAARLLEAKNEAARYRDRDDLNV